MSDQEFGVVVTGSDKEGTMYPSVYGPFATREAADAFAKLVPMEPFGDEGGYQGAIVVPPDAWSEPEELIDFMEEWGYLP